MNTNIKINADSGDSIPKVLLDSINEQVPRMDSYKSVYTQKKRELDKLRAKKPEVYNPSVISSFKALEAHPLNELNILSRYMENGIREFEQFKARIQDNEKLLTMFAPCHLICTKILQTKLEKLEESLEKLINCGWYILYHCRQLLICKYRSLIDLIEMIVCQSGANKPIIVTESYLIEKCDDYWEMEKETGKKVTDLDLLSLGCYSYNADLSKQLYTWLYGIMQTISKKPVQEFNN